MDLKMDENEQMPTNPMKMCKYLLNENYNFIKKYDTYEAKDFQDKLYSLDKYFCTRTEPSSVTVNDLADMQVRPDDVSPDTWIPYLPNVIVDQLAYAANWKKLKFHTSDLSIIRGILYCRDYDGVAKILFSLIQLLNEDMKNIEIIKQLDIDIAMVLSANQCSIVRFMMVKLIRILITNDEMFLHLYQSKVYDCLWDIYLQEFDHLILVDTIKCILAFVKSFKYVVAALLEKDAGTLLYLHLDKNDDDLKEYIYELLIEMASISPEMCDKLSPKANEEMEMVLEDLEVSYNYSITEKVLIFIDLIYKCGSDFQQYCSDNFNINSLIDVIMDPDQIECHRNSISLISKIVSCEDSNTHACFYFKQGRKEIIEALFEYIKNNSLKNEMMATLLDAITRIAHISLLHYKTVLDYGFIKILKHIMEQESGIDDGVLQSACWALHCVVQNEEGLETSKLFPFEITLIEIIRSPDRSIEMKIAAIQCLKCIIEYHNDMRKSIIQALEPEVQQFFVDESQNVYFLAVVQLTTSFGEDLNVLTLETVKNLTKRLLRMVEINLYTSEIYLTSIYYCLLVIVKAVPEVIEVLLLTTADQLVIQILMSENANVPFVDAILNYYNFVFSVSPAYILKMMDTEIFDWLLRNRKLQNATGSVSRALQHFFDYDPVMKFHFTGELTFTDKIPDGFFASTVWNPKTVLNQPNSDVYPSAPVFYININGMPRNLISGQMMIANINSPLVMRYAEYSNMEITTEVDCNVPVIMKGEDDGDERQTVRMKVMDELRRLSETPAEEVVPGKTSSQQLRELLQMANTQLTTNVILAICNFLPQISPKESERVINFLLAEDTNLLSSVGIIARNIDETIKQNQSINLISMVKEIAQDVHLLLGKEMTVKCPKCVMQHIENLMAEQNTNFLRFGELRTGWKLERSILFKVLADRVLVPVCLKRASKHTAWVEVLCPMGAKTGRFIVDLIDNIGNLIPVDSLEADRYKRDWYSCKKANHQQDLQQDEEEPPELYFRGEYITAENRTVVHEIQPDLNIE